MKYALRARSKTSLLWLNYHRILQVARSLIMAVRTGSWIMHLNTVSDCLSIYAAAGNYNYLKSAYYYVQEKCERETKHLDMFRKFTDRFHVIHHSNQCWAGLNSELVIDLDEITEEYLRLDMGKWNERRTVIIVDNVYTHDICIQPCYANLSYTTSEQRI